MRESVWEERERVGVEINLYWMCVFNLFEWVCFWFLFDYFVCVW